MPTPCGRRNCVEPASYQLRDTPDRTPLCSDHAAQICDTDVVEELRDARLRRLVAA